ncbi:pantetheine-phosphate adenylyltransferase [Salsipaludibacter albus]|uniref:pantetheine-phosphate adenylyltransferase n=1 Tax=Salsipaludibacter albus TaxID=2849650 RepID=UPI001EE4A138|nr:pantetheine-phosphate adenylyltransferase [Salsipaludibacter albus]
MSTAVVVPGSFDPITNGHLDVVERVARRFDHVVVAVLVNPGKHGMFTLEERIDLVETCVDHLDDVEVDAFEGLLVDFCRDRGIGCIAKGLRGVGDFDYELQMARMNTRIGDVETLFLPASPDAVHVSSSLVKEVARLGGTIEHAVPEVVARALHDKLADG